jgi:hypothetical protein
MRAVVYFGQQRLSQRVDKNYDLLFPMLDLVTTLDPRFRVAYRFGAYFLSEAPPGGPDRPDLAVKLLENGMQRAPERWEYPHDIGFIYYWHARDYAAAAQWFDRASTIPGAPVWLKSSAAKMLAEGGDRESARLIWRHLRDSVDSEMLKKLADLHLAQFDAMDAIDRLNHVLWAFKLREGRMPTSWQEIIAARRLRGVPTDPMGHPYEIDPQTERVRVARDSPLFPMPEDLQEPGR